METGILLIIIIGIVVTGVVLIFYFHERFVSATEIAKDKNKYDYRRDKDLFS